MTQFSYHSEQVHSTFENGKGTTQRNVVTIKDGKGIKAVEVYKADGKMKTRKQKQLTTKELACIERKKFIPGLFKDCIRPLRPNRTSRRRRAH